VRLVVFPASRVAASVGPREVALAVPPVVHVFTLSGRAGSARATIMQGLQGHMRPGG
jgi:hypothetical protein